MNHDTIAFYLLQKFRLCVVLWIVPASGKTPKDWCGARVAEGCTEIADGVPKLVISFDFDDYVVGILEVPVVNQGHHDLQTLKLRRAGKRILLPLPFATSFPVIRTCFKSDVRESPFARDRHARHEIVDFGDVT